MADDYRNTFDDTGAALGSVDVGTPASGEIETGGDQDVFSINLLEGRQYTLNLNAAGSALGTLGDSYLTLLDSNGNPVATDDDNGPGNDSQIVFFVPPGAGGTYYLVARGYSAGYTGTYQVAATLAPPTPDPTAITTDETRVNQYIAGDQTRPDAASFADGSYIVVFAASGTESPGDQGGIYFQRYDAAGNPVHADGITAGAQETHVNTTTAGYQFYQTVTTLADGKFVVSWTDGVNGTSADGSGEGVYAQLFDTDGTAIGTEIQVNASTYARQTQPVPIATADGGFIIAWASQAGADGSNYGSYAQRFDTNGNFVAWDGSANGNARAETLINTSTTNDQAWTSAVALQGGNSMFLYAANNGGAGGQNGVVNSGTDIYGKIFDASGNVLVDEFRINAYHTDNQNWPHAVVLDNGDIAVTWMSNGQDGSGYGIFGQIVHADGTLAGLEFRVNSYTAGDQENYEEQAGGRLTALSDGGFLVVWHNYEDSSSRGVYYQRFDEHGNKVGGEVQVHQQESGDQSFPDAVATADGFTIFWDSQTQTNTGDDQGYAVVARHYSLETVIAATGGEDQVNTHTTFKQEYGVVATASDGSYVIVWQSETALSTGDGSGWGVFGQRYNADGTRAGSEFAINSTTAGDQASPNVTYLDGANAGKFVVTWSSPDASGSGVYARVFNADGTAASAEFIVNTNTYSDQWQPAVTALHGANAGGFIIGWTSSYDSGGGSVYDVYAQQFDGTFSAVGSQFRVTTVDGANTSDYYESGASVIGTADGGYVFQWVDYGDDGSADGVFAKRYDATGTPLPGTNPDGAAQSNAFRVNAYTGNAQDSNSLHGAVGAFADGSFVSVWQSQYQDGSGWGVYAQVYNADGTILTPEFRVNSALYSDQSDAQVAILADGSFVVVWTSSQTDNGGGAEIYAKRFDANGNVLNQEFIVNTVHQDGDQRWPSVAATQDGFVVTWTDQHENAGDYDFGADGSANGVFKQQFTIDQLNATAGNAGTAHKPGVEVDAATAHEVTSNPNVTDNATALHVVVTPDAAAPGTETTHVEIGGIPVGATLSDGTHSFTATAFQASTSVDGWNLSTLAVTPALNSEAAFTLTVRATSTDSVTHDSETTVAQLPVTISPVALPEALDGAAARVNSTVVGNQTFDAGETRNPIATWADGSYVIVWTSRDGQDGDGDGVYAQKFDAHGNPLGGEIQVNTYTTSSQASPSVATLADGSFVVTWESYEEAATQQGTGSSYYDIYARTFDSTGTGAAEVHVNSFTNYYTSQQDPGITVLSDGGYLIAWQSAGQESDGSWGTYAQRFDADGNMVHRDGVTAGADEIHLNSTVSGDQTNAVTTALQDGGWLAVWNSNGQDGSSWGIYAQRFDASGNMVHADGTALGGGETGAEFLVNTSTGGSQQEPVVLTLADGGWVVAWQDNTNDGSSWGVFAQVYNSDGSARGGQFLVNEYTGNDQSQVSLAATATGGFYAVYHSYDDSDGYAINGQQFDAWGQKVGQEVLLNDDFQHGSQEYPHVAATADGIVVAWQSNYYYGPTNASGEDLPNSWGIFARRMTLTPDHISPTGGENLVNSTTPHEQQSSHSATLANGDYVVVWNSRPSQSSAADHDISDWGVYGQLYHADGTRVGGEFVINSTTDGDQSQPAVAGLDNGGFVVVWQSAVGDGSGYGIYGQRYDASGNAVGSEFLVNSDASGNQYHASIQALHGANAGGFVVTWDNDDLDVHGRIFDASGASTPVAVGNDFSVNLQEPAINGGNNNEHHARIAAGADGGFMVVWHDDSTDGSGSGIFAQRFTANLVTGASAVAGTQPDGSAAADNFRVNHDTYANQWNPDIVALTGGGYVAVWQSDAGDDYGSGIRGQLYNADGTLNGTEFQVNTATVGNQYEPRALALSDGTFVVAWRSNETGANGYDIYANHFDASGHPIDDQFRVDTTTVGDQSEISLAESANGFVISWTSPNQDGSSTGVFEQRFVIDPGPNGGERAVDPTLTVSASSGDQDSAIALHIGAALNDGNGATPETLQLEISNIPAGATIADGAGGHSFTADARVSAVDVAGWNLAQLTITPPTGSTSAITLNVRATATEPDGDIASVATTAQVTVDTVVPPQDPYNVEFTVDPATGRSDSYPRVASFSDGSFVEVWQSNSLSSTTGHGTDVVARLFNADGTPQGAAFVVGPTGSDTPYYNWNPVVAVLADGTFTVAWQAYPISTDSGWEIRAQRFAADGSKLNPDGTPGTTNLLLSTGTDGAGIDAHLNDQTVPQITALADGSYVVAWQSAYEDGSSSTGIYATRIDAAGNVVPMIDDNGSTANVIHVSNAVSGDQAVPSIIELAGGNLVFSYDSPDASAQGTFYRIYDPATGFGAETQINSYTTGGQSSFYRGATLTALADGGFAAVWSSDGQDGSTWGVYAEVFNADGTVRHAEFQVSSYALNQQQEPQITSLPDGGFMAVWTSNGQDGDSWGVYGQRFDATGDRVGTEFRLNTTIAGDESSPSITVQGDGSGVIVTWEDNSAGNKVVAERIPLPDASTPQAIETAGAAQQVNVTTNDQQTQPDVVKLADGTYVVAWQSLNQDGSGWGVYARHYDAAGHSIQWTGGVDELQLNSLTSSSQYNPKLVALADGTFIAGWQDDGYHGGGQANDVFVRHFAADGSVLSLNDSAGTATTTELRVNSNFTSQQVNIALTALTNGSVVVTWASDNGDGSSYGVYSKQLTVVGSDLQLATGADTLVNTHVTGNQYGDDHQDYTAALTNGEYVVVWQSDNNSDGSGWGIYGQIMNADGTAHGSEFLINTETANNQVRASVAALTGGGFVVVWDGDNLDGNANGVAGQLYDASGNPVGGQFQVDAVALNSQYNAWVEGTQDGGFVVAFRSDSFDGSGSGIALRRFDSNAHPSDPYGDDVLVNTTYSLNDQDRPAIATLDNGLVVVWQSNGQDGSSWGIEQQRFQGAGLEPPPLTVDKYATANGTTIFNTIQDALDAAHSGDIIEIVGGADAAHAVTFDESLSVATTGLTIRNRANTFVVIQGDHDTDALDVASGNAITIKGDSAARFVINAGDSVDPYAAIHLEGSNDGSVVQRVTVNAGEAAPGLNGIGSALLIEGGQNGILVQFSAFGGHTVGALAQVLGASSGAAASTGVSFVSNTFDLNGGSGLSLDATGSNVKSNAFNGTGSEAGGALILNASGDDVEQNTFGSAGTPHILDPNGLYGESTLIAQNSFAAPWVWDHQRNGVFSTMGEALAVAQANDYIETSGGSFAFEATPTVGVDNLTVYAPASESGIELDLGTGVTHLTLGGSGGFTVNGNDEGDTIHANDGNVTINGGAGDDTLFGGYGTNTLNGGGGTDMINILLTGGVDTVDAGGDDDDTVVINSAPIGGAPATISESGGTVTVTVGGDTHAIIDGAEVITYDAAYSNDLTITGFSIDPVAIENSTRVNFVGDSGANTVDASGLTGVATINSSAGNDTYIGGAAGLIDLHYTDASVGNGVIVNLGASDQTVNAVTVTAGTVHDEFGNTDTVSIAGILRLTTGDGDDSIWGGNEIDIFTTGAGTDAVHGGGGNDVFNTSSGTKDWYGDAGDDEFNVSSATITVHENAGEGTDIVYTDLASYTLTDNVEYLTGESTAGQTLTGNGSGNIIRTAVGSGNDTVDGAGGDDTIFASGGTDSYTGGTGNDTVNFSAFGTSGVNANLTAGTATGTGLSATLTTVENLTGTGQNDILSGDGNINILVGGAGSDTLYGRGANDVLVGGPGNDVALYLATAADGLLHRDGSGGYTFNGGATEGTDTLTGIETILLAGTDGTFGTADDRSFTIVGGNVALQVAADTGSATEAGGLNNATVAVVASGNVLANDINLDEDATAGDTQRVTSIVWTGATGPGSGSGTTTATAVIAGGVTIQGRYGSLSIGLNGGYTYTPDATKSDLIPAGTTATETFTYSAGDGIVAASSTTLIISLAGRNDTPVASDVSTSGGEDAGTIASTLSATDADQGATLTYALVAGSVKVNGTTVADGTVSVNSNGSYSYATGAADNALNAGETRTITFSYTANDGSATSPAKTATITVNGANDAPTAVADTSNTSENTNKTVDVLANDTDPDTTHVFTLNSASAPTGKGTASVVSNQVLFTPGTDFDHLAQGAHEDVIISYTMQDDHGVTSSSSVTMTVNGVNDAPTSANASVSGSEDNATIGGTLTGSDVDDGTTLTFGLVTGSVKINGTTAADGTVTVNSDGSYSYATGAADNSLNLGEHRTITFDFSVSDGIASIQKSATITVNGANDAPTAVADTSNTSENTNKTVDVLANDTDPDTTHVFTLNSASAPTGKGTASVVSNQLLFTPGTAFDHLAQGAHEDVVISYTMQDDHGVTSSSSVTMTVNGVNDAPTSANASVSGSEDTATIGSTLTGNDVDDGTTLTFGLVTGSVKIDGTTAADGTVTVNSDGSYSYATGAADNALNVGEHRTITFDFSVSDGIASIQKSATITVNGANDAPAANADTGTTGENTAANFDVLANDSDADASHVFTLSSATAPAGKGTVSVVANQVHFDPGTAFDHLALGAHEDVVISYTMQDDHGVTSSSTLTVTVTGTNDAPTVILNAKSLSEDGTISVPTADAGVLRNDSDRDDGETATLKVVGAHFGSAADMPVGSSGTTSIAGTYGTLQIAADGTYAYTADSAAAQALAAGTVVTDTFRYTAADIHGATGSNTLTFTVTGVDDPAVAKDDLVTTNEDAAGTGSLFADHGSGADSDVDGPALAISAVNGDGANVGTQITLASGALLTVNADGSYSYNPNGQFDALAQFGSGAANTTGSDSFSYTLAGGGTATVTVDIHGVASAGDRMDGTAGADAITGTSGDDLFMLQDGGNDSATGGDGNDAFYLGGALTAGDSLDGGAGAYDQLGLQGDYSGGLTFGASNLLGIEMVVLLPGSDTRFGDPGTNLYDYDLTTIDANVGAGERLAVSWNRLQAGEDVHFDGSAENDGSFLTYAGLGVDTIVGGQQNDSFYFGYGMFGASDSVDGQGGTMDELGLQGDYSGAGAIVFAANQLAGIEVLTCMTSDDTRFGLSVGDGYSYDLTMDDGNVGAGKTLYVSANTLMAANGGTLLADETLTFDGSHETDGNFVIYSGAGADHIIGGAGDDTIYGAGGADEMTGGAGNDVFAYINAGHSTASAMDHILDFTSGDTIDLSRIDAVTGGTDDPFSFVGATAFSHTAGELRYEHSAGNDWLVQGDVDGDGNADFQVMVTITDGHTLGPADFVL